jgi:hypothetical protein
LEAAGARFRFLKTEHPAPFGRLDHMQGGSYNLIAQ